jgi:hypothetical protein
MTLKRHVGQEKQVMDQQNRNRWRFIFWLDANKEDQFYLIQFIASLKASREYAPVLRWGLTLMAFLRDIQMSAMDVIDLLSDLKAGNVDVLLRLFPHVRHHPELVDNYSGDEMITKSLERLETLILQQGMTATSTFTPTQNTFQSSASFEIPDLEIKQASRDENNNSTYNFLLASALNVFGNYDSLAPEVIEYGIQTGRIPADKVPKGKGKPAAKSNAGTGNAIPMDVPQFEVPVFDEDFDLDIMDVN